MQIGFTNGMSGKTDFAQNVPVTAWRQLTDLANPVLARAPSQPAAAKDVQPASLQGQSQTGVVGDIIVTAQRRPASMPTPTATIPCSLRWPDSTLLERLCSGVFSGSNAVHADQPRE